jgi:DNA-directed RNA polymerase subunit M/transcription elongation factor TFIIS
MRTCKKCLQEKKLLEFKKHSNGHRHTCKQCQYQSMMNNPSAHENAIKRNRKWRESDKGKATELAYSQSKLGKKSRRQAIKKYEKTFIGYVNKYTTVAKRRAARIQRTPAWLTDIDRERIKNEYKLTALLSKIEGTKWTVDHIIPLQGEFVSGLHVPSNLKAMRFVENCSKGNKFKVLA